MNNDGKLAIISSKENPKRNYFSLRISENHHERFLPGKSDVNQTKFQHDNEVPRK